MTTKQHYVPQFYLRQWVDSSGGFYAVKVESRVPPELKILQQKSSPRKFCYENFFYANKTGKKDQMSQEVEKAFADVEEFFAEIISNIESKILNNEQIIEEDKYHLSQFMVFLWLRGKEYRNQSQHMADKLIKWLNKFMIQDIDSIPGMVAEMESFGLTKEDMIEFVEKEEYNVTIGNSHQLSMMKEMPGFCNLLFAKYWKIYISRGGDFIATDTPYLDMPTSNSWWGNDFLSREQSFILSPRVAIVALYPRRENGKKVVRKDISQDRVFIQSFNCFNLMNSIRFGFHGNKRLLEELQGQIMKIFEIKNRQQISAH